MTELACQLIPGDVIRAYGGGYEIVQTVEDSPTPGYVRVETDSTRRRTFRIDQKVELF